MSNLLKAAQRGLSKTKLTIPQICNKTGLTQNRLRNFMARTDSYGIAEVESVLEVVNPELFEEITEATKL